VNRSVNLVELEYGERLLALALIAREQRDVELAELLIARADETFDAIASKTTDVEPSK
jgi:hypothetical protein